MKNIFVTLERPSRSLNCWVDPGIRVALAQRQETHTRHSLCLIAYSNSDQSKDMKLTTSFILIAIFDIMI
jgi:hypothetical protein